jgi:hypothetical protein
MASVLLPASLLAFPVLAASQETKPANPDPTAAQGKPASKKPDLSATQLALQGLLKAQVPATLEEFLAKALKENPDIRLAESKVREAEAQLTKTRLDVMQKVVKLHHDIVAFRTLVKEAQDQLALKKKLYDEGALPLAAFQASTQALQQAKSNLAKAEVEVPFLIGNQLSAAAFSADGKTLAWTTGAQVIYWDVVTGKQLSRQFFPATALIVRGPQSEKLRAILDIPVQGEFDADKLLKLFREKAKGFNLFTESYHHFRRIKTSPDYRPPTLRLTEPVPLGAALQWFEDVTFFRFVTRAYGIVLIERNGVPPGAAFLLDLWKEAASTNK